MIERQTASGDPWPLPMSVSTRNALVTGGITDIALAAAGRLAKQGHRVILAHFEDQAPEKLASQFADARMEIAFERVDPSNAAAVSDFFARLAQMDREPDFLINAADVRREAPLASLDVVDFDSLLVANLRAVVLSCQQAVKGMIRRGFGRIINFSSPAAVPGNEGQVAYASSKAGVIGLTRALARELGRFGITVNAISPGPVRTQMTSELSPERMKELVRHIPLRRLGTAEEIAGMIAMLCDEKAGYITGQCLGIDGGLS